MKVVAHSRFVVPKPKTERTVFMLTVTSQKERGRTRCWGWFATQEDAEALVLVNATDMFEMGYYTHAVIEEFPEGIMPMAKKTWWYEAKYSTPELGVFPMPNVRKLSRRPKKLRSVCNFGIG